MTPAPWPRLFSSRLSARHSARLVHSESKILSERFPPASENLRASLAPLLSHPHVGEIRGLGLLLGIEFVKDKSTREPFPREENIAERIRQAALDQNLLVYPTQGCVDGLRGDHVLLAPPFVISAQESEQAATALHSALQRVFRQ